MIRSHSILALTLTGLTAASAHAASAVNAPEIAHSVIEIDGDMIDVWSGGEGPVGVLFEAGFGEAGSNWEIILADVAQFAPVLAYSRPHDVASFDDDGQRTPDEVAALAEQLTEDRGLSTPYVIVAHSYGGIHAIAHATLYPDRVGGLVMSDARMPDFSRRCANAGASCVFSVPDMDQLPAGLRSEAAGALAYEAALPELALSADMPVSVLISFPGLALQPGRPLRQHWIDAGEDFAAFFEGGTSQRVDAGHYLHLEEPELVLAEIRRVVALVDARSSADGGPE